MKKTKRIILIIVILFVVTVSVFFVCFFTGYKIYRNVRYGETENDTDRIWRLVYILLGLGVIGILVDVLLLRKPKQDSED